MKLRENVKRVKRPDKSFIFSVKEGDLFEINQVGEFIIDKIEENKSKEEIVESLYKETGEDKKVISKDVEDFITQLKEKGFLI